MPSSNLRPYGMWPASWIHALSYLAQFPGERYVLDNAGTRQALATSMRKAQAMRESVYALPGWPPSILELARTHKLRLTREFAAGVWVLYLHAEPLTHDLGKMFLLALQNPQPVVDMREESRDDPDSPAPDTAHRQAP